MPQVVIWLPKYSVLWLVSPCSDVFITVSVGTWSLNRNKQHYVKHLASWTSQECNPAHSSCLSCLRSLSPEVTLVKSVRPHDHQRTTEGDHINTGITYEAADAAGISPNCLSTQILSLLVHHTIICMSQSIIYSNYGERTSQFSGGFLKVLSR